MSCGCMDRCRSDSARRPRRLLGEPLDHILRAAETVGGVPIPMVVHFLLQALGGLRAVHEARDVRGEPLGIVHRDVSPQNLLVTYEGVVKLIDFGIAKATQQMSRCTEQGMIKGKFAYMSPEQLRSEPLDARADLFGLGVVLYRATTGMHPFQGDNLAATMRNILMGEPQRPTALLPGYSEALEEVVLRALSKDRSDRFGSAQEMMLALEQAVPEVRLAGIDAQCETFLRLLFADRIAERTRALQAAM
jgi:serine/threonine protein kinase